MPYDPVLLRNLGVLDSQRLEVYKSRGGFRGNDRFLECVRASRLDGDR